MTAADILQSADVEIVNPDLVLMTIDSDDVTIEMDLTVERGVGYLGVERTRPCRSSHRRRRDLRPGPEGQLLGREHAGPR